MGCEGQEPVYDGDRIIAGGDDGAELSTATDSGTRM